MPLSTLVTSGMTKDDLVAIGNYFASIPIQTPAAEKIKQDWLTWWQQHSSDWYYTQDDYQHAMNLKTQFNAANAVTSEEKQAAKTQATTGLTKEEIQGMPKQTGSDGLYVEPPKPLISGKTKMYLVLGGITAALAWGVKKAYLDPFLNVGKKIANSAAGKLGEKYGVK